MSERVSEQTLAELALIASRPHVHELELTEEFQKQETDGLLSV